MWLLNDLYRFNLCKCFVCGHKMTCVPMDLIQFCYIYIYTIYIWHMYVNLLYCAALLSEGWRCHWDTPLVCVPRLFHQTVALLKWLWHMKEIFKYVFCWHYPFLRRTLWHRRHQYFQVNVDFTSFQACLVCQLRPLPGTMGILWSRLVKHIFYMADVWDGSHNSPKETAKATLTTSKPQGASAYNPRTCMFKESIFGVDCNELLDFFI